MAATKGHVKIVNLLIQKGKPISLFITDYCNPYCNIPYYLVLSYYQFYTIHEKILPLSLCIYVRRMSHLHPTLQAPH